MKQEVIKRKINNSYELSQNAEKEPKYDRQLLGNYFSKKRV
jgi:hypothetical protein